MAKEGGSIILYVALIFSIILLVGAIGAVVKMNSDLEKETAKWTKEKDKNKKLQARIKEKTLQLDEAFKVVNGGQGPVSYDQYEKTILKDARTTLESILSGEWVTKEDIDLIKDQRIKDTWEKLLEFKNEKREYTNLVDLYKDLLMQLKAVIHVIPRLRSQRVMKIEELEQARGKFEQDRIAFKREVEDLNNKLQVEADKLLEQARQFDQEKRRLTDEIDRINKEKNRLEKVKKYQIARLESEKNTLKQRIKEIIKKEKKSFEVSGADGEVIFSEPDLGYAWIDLGKNHNLRPGMTFQVFRYVKGGRKRLKGKIIVKTVEADMAKATIVDNAKLRDPITKKWLVLPREDDPIVKGDLIRNPLFDRDEQQVFVFLGNKVTNGVYKRKELERKIEEAGSKVDKTISIRTNFVILLGGAEEDAVEELEKAAQFGVIFMKESELLEYLSR